MLWREIMAGTWHEEVTRVPTRCGAVRTAAHTALASLGMQTTLIRYTCLANMASEARTSVNYYIMKYGHQK